jgi:hypothetical protein
MTDPESLSGQMLDRLTACGELTPGWSGAFAAVARHRFIPDTIWSPTGTGWCRYTAAMTRQSGCDALTLPPQ